MRSDDDVIERSAYDASNVTKTKIGGNRIATRMLNGRSRHRGIGALAVSLNDSVAVSAQSLERLFTRLRGVHTALISDVLDAQGHRVGVMDPAVRPLTVTRLVVGTAFTVAASPIDEPEAVPYEKLLAAYREVKAGDIMVIATNGELRSAIWGELLTVAAKSRGAIGVVTDGLTRDIEQIRALAFPLFARGISPLDSAGRQAVYAFAERITCGGVDIEPGDVVAGDAMGVVVIPQGLAVETSRLVEEKLAAEDTVREELERGDDIADVFRRHGVL